MSERMHTQPIIQIHRVRKAFDEHHVLKNVSFAVEKGSVHGLIGLSGAGKSTLLNCLVGYYEIDAGRILIDREDHKKAVKTRIGFTTQNNCFYEDLTLWDNIKYFGDLYSVPRDTLKKRAKYLLNIVELSDALHTRATNLSGGMKRRFDLVLSLLHKPDILILDEPATGLDPMLRRKIWFIVKYINNLGVTTIISSHLLNDLEELCDNISLLHNGTIISSGSPSELRDLFSHHHQIRVQTAPGNYKKVLKTLKQTGLKIHNPRRDAGKFVFITKHTNLLLRVLHNVLEATDERIVDFSIQKPGLEDLMEKVAS